MVFERRVRFGSAKMEKEDIPGRNVGIMALLDYVVCAASSYKIMLIVFPDILGV